MIALNELVSKKDEFERLYQVKGKSFDLDFILKKTKLLKEFQLESEHKRAECNKLCGTVPQKLNDDAELKVLMKKINMLDKSSIKFKKKAMNIEKIINHRLEVFDNLPDYEIQDNLNLSNIGKELTDEKMFEFFRGLCNNKIFDENVSDVLKFRQNRIFDENEFPAIYGDLNHEFLLLCTENEVNQLLNKILEFFKLKASSVTQIATDKLSFESASEYCIELNEQDVLKINMIREFWTRKFKIKYKDSSVDATKFVNQINFKLIKKMPKWGIFFLLFNMLLFSFFLFTRFFIYCSFFFKCFN